MSLIRCSGCLRLFASAVGLTRHKCRGLDSDVRAVVVWVTTGDMIEAGANVEDFR